MAIKFKAKLTHDANLNVIENMQDFKSRGLEYQDEYVIGHLVMEDDKPYLVGDIEDITDEYIHFKWWLPVEPDTVEMIEDV